MTNPKVDEFVQKLQAAASGNLKSVILYGSAVTGEFHSKHSDYNLLCVLGSAHPKYVMALQASVEWWNKQGNPPPMIFTVEELHRSADVFAIEFLDMKAHHQVLVGHDVLADITVPLRYHAIQVERELRTGWSRLRQAILAAPNKSKNHLDLMVASYSTFVALFRHVLIALGEQPAGTKSEAVERIARFAAADPSAFHSILEHRTGKRESQEINVEETLSRYFAFVEAVTDKFDRWLDSRN